MSAGINEILIISTSIDTPRFKELLGNGLDFGCKFNYAIQEQPNGLAEAFIIGEKFIGKDKVALILGDNIFYGSGLDNILKSTSDPDGGVISHTMFKIHSVMVLLNSMPTTKQFQLRKNQNTPNQIMQFQGYIFMIIQL
jgi:NDP-sugar pyrophosphorylase family protein